MKAEVVKKQGIFKWDKQEEKYKPPEIAIMRFKKVRGIWKKNARIKIGNFEKIKEIIKVLNEWMGDKKVVIDKENTTIVEGGGKKEDIIEKEIENLTDEGVLPAGSPQKDADGKKVLFLHPKTTGGVLIELIEK